MLIDFAKYSSVKIGKCLEVKQINHICKLDSFIVGNASNLLINNAKNLAILGDEFSYIKQNKNIIKIGAKTPASKLFNYCKKYNLAGLEFLANLPGSMGGIAKMNAGLKEFEIAQFIKSVNIDGNECLPNFSYRNSDILGCIFELTLELQNGFRQDLLNNFIAMRANQPKGASFGSIFKNPLGQKAGALIESAGLKGFIKGGAKISEIHANFLINFANASFDDAIYLIKLAQEKVEANSGIILEPEVIILDE